MDRKRERTRVQMSKIQPLKSNRDKDIEYEKKVMRRRKRGGKAATCACVRNFIII